MLKTMGKNISKLQKLIRETIKEIQLKEAPCVSFVMQNYGIQPPPFNMIGNPGQTLTCGTNPQFTPLNTPSGGTAYCSTPQLEGCTYTYDGGKSMWFLAKDKGKIQPNPNPEDFGGGMGHPSGLGHSKGHSNKITKNMSRPGARTKRR